MLLNLIICLALTATIVALLPTRTQKHGYWISAGVHFISFLYLLNKHVSFPNEAILTESYTWISSLGLEFSFVLDGLNSIFALLITGIGALVFLYAGAYMNSYEYKGRFYGFLGMFSASMLGLVLSDNAIVLFLFWELTSLLSFMLISFFHEKETSRKAAFQSLFVTGLGGLFLLTGFIIIGNITGTYQLSEWYYQSELIQSAQLYPWGFVAILMGVFTKSAQFPFHFWLPDAMQAPTPVSAFLHSATMVKAGVFLLFRLTPSLGGSELWVSTIPIFGLITMLLGAYFAITQTDLKAIFAYSTISSLGLMVMLIGFDTEKTIKAALVFLLVHALYKATLFMVAGIVDKKTGTRDINKTGNLFGTLPLTGVVTILALLSMSGIPPMLGFIGKELIYEASVQLSDFSVITLASGVLTNILMVAISFYLIYKLFVEHTPSASIRNTGFDYLFITGPLLLGGVGFMFGLFPNLLQSTIEPALSLVQGQEVEVKLYLWHGFNGVLILSMLTLFCGFAFFWFLKEHKTFLKAWQKLNLQVFTIDLSEIFQLVIKAMVAFSDTYRRKIQHGNNQLYILTVILITSLLLWYQVWGTQGWELKTQLSFHPFYVTGVLAVIIAVSVLILFTKSRLISIIYMGVSGYGISLLYLYYSAVDLAITQILVETISVILFVLILERLPRFATLSSKAIRIRDFTVALSFGIVMSILALKAINIELHHPISNYFFEHSYTKANGENIVNVILVDFRALDTLGEVVVLSVAASGVAVLLSRSKKLKRK